MTKLSFPIVVALHDEHEMDIVREALTVTRNSLIREWNTWMNLDRSRLDHVKREIEIVDGLLDQVGFTVAGPRRS